MRESLQNYNPVMKHCVLMWPSVEINCRLIWRHNSKSYLCNTHSRHTTKLPCMAGLISRLFIEKSNNTTQFVALTFSALKYDSTDNRIGVNVTYRWTRSLISSSTREPRRQWLCVKERPFLEYFWVIRYWAQEGNLKLTHDIIVWHGWHINWNAKQLNRPVNGTPSIGNWSRITGW